MSNGRLTIEYLPLSQLQVWPTNPKLHDTAGIGASMRRYSYTDPVMIDEATGRLVRGHGRREVLLAFKAAGEPPPPHVEIDASGEWLVPVLRGVAFANEAEAEEYVVADNQLVIAGGWDDARLAPILQRVLARNDNTIDALGFTSSTAQAVIDSVLAGDGGGGGAAVGSLAERFIVPPFTVLDARSGYWQDRKRAWLALGIRSELGRGDVVPGGAGENAAWKRTGADTNANPLAQRGRGGMSEQLAPRKGKRGDARTFGQDLMRGEHVVGAPRPNGTHAPAAPFGEAYKGGDAWRAAGAGGDGPKASGTSIFDPVLCELAYRWFCPPGGHVLDPFAGGSVRGIVAAKLGRSYTGIDLRAEQVAANVEQAQVICPDNVPRWVAGDSRQVGKLAAGKFDLVFSCPPYGDLERYSDDERDLSTLPYPRFLEQYRAIVAACVAQLRRDRFACFVVGNFRDASGRLNDLVGDTVAAFGAAGAALYNDAILVTAVGSLPVRAGRQFAASRKLGRTHQAVLVFVKGDPAKAVKACGDVEVAFPDGLLADEPTDTA